MARKDSVLGFVCDDSFSQYSANVACEAMIGPGSEGTYYTQRSISTSTYDFTLDDFACDSGAHAYKQCAWNLAGDNCGSGEGILLSCSTPALTNVSLALVPEDSALFRHVPSFSVTSGIVVARPSLSSDPWMPLCWDSSEAALSAQMCRSMGLTAIGDASAASAGTVSSTSLSF